MIVMKEKQAVESVASKTRPVVGATGEGEADTERESGMYLIGVCHGRQRRKFDSKTGEVRYNIGLAVLTDDGIYKAERWVDSPTPADVPTVGSEVRLKVTVSYYQTKAGSAMRLMWGPPSFSESF